MSKNQSKCLQGHWCEVSLTQYEKTFYLVEEREGPELNAYACDFYLAKT